MKNNKIKFSIFLNADINRYLEEELKVKYYNNISKSSLINIKLDSIKNGINLNVEDLKRIDNLLNCVLVSDLSQKQQKIFLEIKSKLKSLINN
jgi:hypothetical protein